jgi:hypothetical protein
MLLVYAALSYYATSVCGLKLLCGVDGLGGAYQCLCFCTRKCASVCTFVPGGGGVDGLGAPSAELHTSACGLKLLVHAALSY